ncbi:MULTISPECIES: dihydroneopterin triphosphate diphosphatase [unclassified Gilliamella]|uniref:dihydroneopterin triphosphate diphosphatase n=1 Tax=unclassified Gilliamella TaxID=2685620 RepID=UPI00226AF4E7|nr:MULTISPECIES: dihydroneopterin triphosphate diphosphatase [unclassified Gilliamella]MCX8643132.1 dihydroneopterin triphosphate diphosphatase [Gilliamella sp. B3835]MCX8708523.1 dihydroneopterin triphosphate diphosphatase [Gilliamella sp. B3783]MCX8709560.1 dihydroneopterin triphosphate diphosphatase [Gilliamella sp. B3780]MCX8711916.1 dihydroneopterin triphosphate diphosphatase [Gilliamella sp. B3468]MCX8715301.1 dihydroneopterin triphosphate diphosphatase [Gilliamella sp. B3781]
MQTFKKPESVLVVIYCQTTLRCLMMQRKDDPNFWQSVTGSLENNELPIETAIREVYEETGIDIVGSNLSLVDAKHVVEFEIFPQFRHRYAPQVKINKEHWFYLPLTTEVKPMLSEHLAYQWMSIQDAANLTLSPNNREAIKKIVNY